MIYVDEIRARTEARKFLLKKKMEEKKRLNCSSIHRHECAEASVVFRILFFAYSTESFSRENRKRGRLKRDQDK